MLTLAVLGVVLTTIQTALGYGRGSKPTPSSPRLFEAMHKHAFGGCRGRLSLGDQLEFLPYEALGHRLTFLKSRVVIDADGIMDISHKKWHFAIYGMSSDQVHRLLEDWKEQ
jgi:hypothetical protein